MLNNEQLCDRLTSMLKLMHEHGSRAEPVRQFVLAAIEEDPQFRGLAMVLMLCFEARRGAP